MSQSDFIESPKWASDEFIFEDEDEWKQSIDRCYTMIPTKTFKRFKFVYMPDSNDQIGVKMIAAETALEFVMEQYKKIR